MTQTVTVNLHNPVLQNIRRQEESGTIELTLGNGQYHGSVYMFLSDEGWRAMASSIQTFFDQEFIESIIGEK